MEKEKCVDLQSCIEWVHENAEETAFYHWLKQPEDSFVVTTHHGFGTWVRNTLGLWEDGPPVAYFHSLGIYHADDMSGIIFTSLWRKYHNVNIDLNEQVREYREFWEEHDPKVNEGKYGK